MEPGPLKAEEIQGIYLTGMLKQRCGKLPSTLGERWLEREAVT